MKKMFALILALVMVFSMAATAFADGETGSITINGASADNTYEIYKLLDLQSYDTTANKYSYKVNPAWAEFFATTEAQAYMAVDADGYANWAGAEDADAYAAFAKLALAYAKANDIDPVQSSRNEGQFVITTVDGKTSGKFSDLELGYYLIDSTMGALCGLTTTNPNASINAKNGVPTIDKQVQEDSTEQWKDENTADIGQIVNFRTTINVHAGAEGYILHDKMSNGLTFQGVSKIEHLIPEVSTTVVDAGYYEVITEGLTDGCTFHVEFTQAFCDHLETNDKIVVSYEAMLNRHALIAGGGNENSAWLDFGEGHTTGKTPDVTRTYTFGIDIVKTDSQNALLNGASFLIYDAAEGGNVIAVVPLMEDDDVTPKLDDNGKPMYRRARADEQKEQDEKGYENIVVSDGQITVVGFDNGTYYLEEIVAPAGYNKLTARQKFIISDGNLDAVFNDGIYSTGSGVHVVNKSGSMLPETGAMGTLMFISFGMFVALATGVLLITKKRTSMIED